MKAISYSLIFWILLISFLVLQDCRAPQELTSSNYPIEEKFDQESVSSEIKKDSEDKIMQSQNEGNERLENPLTDLALVALKKTKCAGCHTKSLPTAIEGALAIFNLEDSPWHLKFKEDHHLGFTRRISEEAGIPDEDKKLLLDFIDCQKSKDCQSDS